MPEIQGPKKGSGEKKSRQFISEKIVKQPLTKRQVATRGAFVVFTALIFGAVSAFSFTAVKPLAGRLFGEEEPTETPVFIPKDEPTDVSAPDETAPPESEPIEEQVQTVMENYRFTVDDMNSMLSSLRMQVQKAEKGIVTVHSVQQGTDWFDNSMETTGLYAGVIVADNGQEILILTPDAAVENADSIRVAFGEKQETDGQIKQKDAVSGMAVVSVSMGALESSVRDSLEVLTLGNSYTVRQGDLILAVGGPSGIVHSLDYGYVSYVQKNALMADRVCRVLYSRISADAQKGTFLLNTSGELIGWAMEPQGNADGSTNSSVQIMGISDYKGILEKLTNGASAPYLGVIGQEVSESMTAQGLPNGIYVMNVIADSPAYNAGIQSGDVIVGINGASITSMKEYQSAVDGMEVGQQATVSVERNGREQYTQLEFPVTVGSR